MLLVSFNATLAGTLLPSPSAVVVVLALVKLTLTLVAQPWTHLRDAVQDIAEDVEFLLDSGSRSAHPEVIVSPLVPEIGYSRTSEARQI